MQSPTPPPQSPATPPSDEPHAQDLALARSALAGDPASARAFAERMRCIPRMLGSLTRGRYTDDDLADLAQEVFGTVWARLGTYRGGATLETWVYRFCELSLLGESRRRRRREALRLVEGDAEPPPVDPPSEEELDPLDAGHVHAALSELDPKERGIVERKQFEGLTFEEIAEQLDISPNTAKTRYYRGLQRLRSSLGPKLGEEES